MILHVLRFRFCDAATQDDVDASLQALERLGDAPSVSSRVIGRYLAGSDKGFTYAAAFGLGNLEAFERYVNEPVHREADFIVHPHAAVFESFDVAEDDDPELRAKMVAIQGRRMRADPELAALLGRDP